MSDDDVLRLERRFRASGLVEDEAAWLRARARASRAQQRFRPALRYDRASGRADLKITYVSPGDCDPCSATTALLLLEDRLREQVLEPLTSIATDGDRTLFLTLALPTFDLGPARMRVGVYCVRGSAYFRATRQLALEAAAGVVYVPSLVAGMKELSVESAEDLVEDLESHGLQPQELPIALQWLPGDERPEVAPEEIREELDLPFLGTFTTDRRTGEGIEAALFAVVARAREAFLESGGLSA